MKSFNNQDSGPSKNVPEDVPPEITNENKFDIADGFFYGEFNDAGRMVFNFMYEYMERNKHNIFPLDIYKMGDLSNEQLKKLHGIIQTAQFNASVMAARFVSGEYYPDLQFEIKPPEK